MLGGAAAALALGCARGASSVTTAASPAPDRPAPKRVLVLGGTGFAGPPIVRAAFARGHTVTLFNRGKTNPHLFPDVETILGDRMTQLDLLRGRQWDAVVDTWAQGPTLVQRAAEMLRDEVHHYVFLSTISVYNFGKSPVDEASPVLHLPAGVEVKDIKKVDETVYGPLKALAERAAEEAMPGRTTSVRSGLIAGPGDKTQRFSYWPLRMSGGGEMIVPGAPSDPMQFIDVRDLGEWMITAVEGAIMGTFNAVGPTQPTIGAILADMKTALASAARLTWVDHAWLAKHDAAGWENFPAAVPPDDEMAGFARVSAARAIAKGLRFRSPGETAKDALAWSNDAHPGDLPGIKREREAELLALWHHEHPGT